MTEFYSLAGGEVERVPETRDAAVRELLFPRIHAVTGWTILNAEFEIGDQKAVLAYDKQENALRVIAFGSTFINLDACSYQLKSLIEHSERLAEAVAAACCDGKQISPVINRTKLVLVLNGTASEAPAGLGLYPGLEVWRVSMFAGGFLALDRSTGEQSGDTVVVPIGTLRHLLNATMVRPPRSDKSQTDVNGELGCYVALIDDGPNLYVERILGKEFEGACAVASVSVQHHGTPSRPVIVEREGLIECLYGRRADEVCTLREQEENIAVGLLGERPRSVPGLSLKEVPFLRRRPKVEDTVNIPAGELLRSLSVGSAVAGNTGITNVTSVVRIAVTAAGGDGRITTTASDGRNLIQLKRSFEADKSVKDLTMLIPKAVADDLLRVGLDASAPVMLGSTEKYGFIAQGDISWRYSTSDKPYPDVAKYFGRAESGTARTTVSLSALLRVMQTAGCAWTYEDAPGCLLTLEKDHLTAEVRTGNGESGRFSVTDLSVRIDEGKELKLSLSRRPLLNALGVLEAGTVEVIGTPDAATQPILMHPSEPVAGEEWRFLTMPLNAETIGSK